MKCIVKAIAKRWWSQAGNIGENQINLFTDSAESDPLTVVKGEVS